MNREASSSPLSSSRRRPTSTVSGTRSATAPSIRSRTSAAVSSAAAFGASNSSSSWTVRIIRAGDPLATSAPMDVDHRALEDVGGAALNREVDRVALRARPDLEVAARQIGHQPAPAEHGLHDAALARGGEQVVDEGADRREAGEVGVDEFLRRLLRHADVLGQRERGLPVEQRVVDDLRAAAQLVLAEPAVLAEDLRRGAIVDVDRPA